MDITPAAAPGSVAGASGDGGVEYRRGVAAYIVACGFAGKPLVEFGVPQANADVESVALETEDPLDDIRVNFKSGWTALIQAKRTLAKGRNFEKAVDQWAQAARTSLAPETHRFVIVGGQLSGPIKDLQQVLKRNQTDLPGPPTKAEAESIAYLRGLLKDLTPEQEDVILRCGVICELSVEDVTDSDAKLAAHYLQQVTLGGNPHDGIKAWNVLTAAAGKTARLRGGYSLGGWLEELRGAGISIDPAGKTPAAEMEFRYKGVERYKDRLIRAGSVIDLRGLGAQLAPIPIDESDAHVRVGTDPEDEWAEADLLWAFLRRGRVVLTGLPGGGKSTAIRSLAARLCTLPGAPLPVRVSLREIDALGSAQSFRDRLLDVATRDDAARDRPLLRSELEDRLSTGGVALLLDSLDETYDRRAAVAKDIDEFMASVSEDVDVLLSTRDVAYGEAATLGWSNLSLRPPSETDRTVEAILVRVAEANVSQAERDNWLQDRIRWVQEALSRDAALRETPLFPVLLALLAAEKDLDTLPSGRARVLADIVRDAVKKHEVTRLPANPLGPLPGSAIDNAVMHAFAVEASAILDASGSIKLEQLEAAVAKEVASHWQLSQGFAEITAREAIRYLDGIGIFVHDARTDTVSPRIALFAEIGDALRATIPADTLEDWIAARLQSRQFEPVILAAGLNQTAAEALGDMASESRDRDVLHATVRAVTEGAALKTADLRSIITRLTEDLQTGAPAAWASWAHLLQLPLTVDMRDDIESAARSFDPQRQKLVMAQLDLKFCSSEELQREPASLLSVLELEHLPHLPGTEKRGVFDVTEFFETDQLGTVQIAAAKVLLGKVPEATELILERAKHGTPGLHDDLCKLLTQSGFEAEAAGLAEPLVDLKKLDWFQDYEPDSDRRFLSLLAERQPADLTYQQQSRCHELADFVATLRLNDISSIYMFQHEDDVPRVVQLTESLYTFDSGVVTSQARLILQRMDVSGDSDPYHTLFGNATARHEPDWGAISDVPSAVDLLGRMTMWGKAHAWYVAEALWAAPVAENASVMLRERLPKLVSSSEHLRIAALTLCSLVDGPEPLSWLNNTSPVLRGVAAKRFETDENGYLTQEHVVLLTDADRGVRLDALNRAAKLNPPDLEDHLLKMAKEPPVGWMCRSCRTMNAPESDSCSKKRCFRVGPKLLKRTHELLERFSQKGTSR